MTISLPGTNVMVCWPDTGVTYNLQAKTDVLSTNWITLSPLLTVTNSQFCALLPATNSMTFYRLRKP